MNNDDLFAPIMVGFGMIVCLLGVMLEFASTGVIGRLGPKIGVTAFMLVVYCYEAR